VLDGDHAERAELGLGRGAEHPRDAGGDVADAAQDRAGRRRREGPGRRHVGLGLDLVANGQVRPAAQDDVVAQQRRRRRRGGCGAVGVGRDDGARLDEPGGQLEALGGEPLTRRRRGPGPEVQAVEADVGGDGGARPADVRAPGDVLDRLSDRRLPEQVDHLVDRLAGRVGRVQHHRHARLLREQLRVAARRVAGAHVRRRRRGAPQRVGVPVDARQSRAVAELAVQALAGVDAPVDDLVVVGVVAVAAGEHRGDVFERGRRAAAEVPPAEQDLHEDVRRPDDRPVEVVRQPVDHDLEGGGAERARALDLDHAEVVVPRHLEHAVVRGRAVRTRLAQLEPPARVEADEPGIRHGLK
jgi:hypothetical protein